MRIIEAIVAGQREARELVKLRDPRCHKSTPQEMEAGLKGTYDEEQLFVLGQALKAWEFYQEQMAQCDLRIEKVLAQLPTAKPAQAPVPPKPVTTVPTPKQALRKRTQHGPNAANIDFRVALTRICGVDLIKV
jgi:hypothetical protein